MCSICDHVIVGVFFFLMIRRPPRSTRTDTLFPYTTLFRSARLQVQRRARRAGVSDEIALVARPPGREVGHDGLRSEEHTSELQSLMRISYAVFCLKKKIKLTYSTSIQIHQTL